MPYKSELVDNAEETIKNICYEKSEGAVGYSTIIWWLKTFRLDCKNLDDQVMSSRSKAVNYEAVLQAMEVNQGNGTRWVSDELGISQSRVVRHLNDPRQRYWIVPHVGNILQNLWLSLELQTAI